MRWTAYGAFAGAAAASFAVGNGPSCAGWGVSLLLAVLYYEYSDQCDRWIERTRDAERRAIQAEKLAALYRATTSIAVDDEPEDLEDEAVHMG